MADNDELLYGTSVIRSGGNGPTAYNPLVAAGADTKDIADVQSGIMGIRSGAKNLFRGVTATNRHVNSIIGKAQANVFEFPVFISDSVPLEYATATNTLLEQVYASYLQMALSIDPVVSYKVIESRRKKGQFSAFKTNTTKYLECADLGFQKDACHARYVNEDGSVCEFSLVSIEDSDASIINESLEYQPLSEFDHYFQESETTRRSPRQVPPSTETRMDENDNVTGRTVASGRVEPGSTETTTHEFDPSAVARIARRYMNGDMANDFTRALFRGNANNRPVTTDEDTIKSLASLASTYFSIKGEERRANAENVQGTTKEMEELVQLIWKNDLAPAQIDNINAATEKLNRELAAARLFTTNHRGVSPEYQRLLNELSQGTLTRAQIEKIGVEIDNLKTQGSISSEELKKLYRYNDAAKEFQKVTKISPELYDMVQSKFEREAKIAHDEARHLREEAKEKREQRKFDYETKATKAAQFIDEAKIQKMNTMKPLMMVVNMAIMGKDGQVSHPMEYVVGVKTHCRIVESSMLPEVVSYPLKEMNRLTRKAKWRAGELKFLKDIVFHIKEKKQTAIDSRDPRRKWFRRLYELAHMKGDGTVSMSIAGRASTDGLIPNATIIISKSDVDHIEDVTKIDMLKPSAAYNFCEQLFLMNFIVIDIDSESIKIFTPDINRDFEVQSLAAVNKQIAQLDTAGTNTREIFKMLK